MGSTSASTSSTTAPVITNDEEAAAYEASLTAYRQQEAATAKEARDVKLKPITDLLASDAWAAFRTGIAAADIATRDEPFWVHVNALNTISANLPSQVL